MNDRYFIWRSSERLRGVHLGIAAILRGGVIMYMNPFWVGVLATIFTELLILFVSSMVIIWRANR